MRLDFIRVFSFLSSDECTDSIVVEKLYPTFEQNELTLLWARTFLLIIVLEKHVGRVVVLQLSSFISLEQNSFF